jgi:hypothetical protein
MEQYNPREYLTGRHHKDNTISSESILLHIETLKNQAKNNGNPFPVDVFPSAVQEIIAETNKCLSFPVDFVAASVLYAASISIGNTYRVEIRRGHPENAVLYIAIVGRTGTNKTHPVEWILRPIKERDNLKFNEYQIKRREYENLVSLSKKEREQQGYSEPERPFWEQYLVNDFTPEALVSVHSYNKRGLGVAVDELATWFKNFDRYNKGSEQEFWLSVWSGSPVKVNRKTSDQYNIPIPFISVIGTIQPGVLNELAENRTENGFLERLMFVFPDELKREYWGDEELNPEIEENWCNIISRLLSLPLTNDNNNNPQPKLLRFTPDARSLLFEWQRKSVDQSNSPENEAISGIYAKNEIYAGRLALILQMLRYACNEDGNQIIGIKAVKGALQIVEYFKKTAIKVHSIVSEGNPLVKLPSIKQELYNSLPEIFTTNQGLKIAGDLGIPERTFKRFLNNKELFRWIRQGEYEKLA